LDGFCTPLFFKTKINGDMEMLLTLISAVAQNESFAMSENVKWGVFLCLICGFEAYLKDKELSVNTISSYIRDSKAFIDWYSGRTNAGLDKLIQCFLTG